MGYFIIAVCIAAAAYAIYRARTSRKHGAGPFPSDPVNPSPPKDTE